MNTSLRVLLADDHQLILRGLRELLEAERDLEIVGEATNGVQALEFIFATDPDIAIVDISMPGLNGIALAEKVSIDRPQVRVILLTGQEDYTYVTQAIRAGAAGYVLKRSVTENLIQAIRAAARKEIYIDPAVATSFFRSSLPDGEHENKAQLPRLTNREIDALRLTARGHTNKEIARMMRVSVKTVETFKARATTKCRLTSRADIVRYAIAQGWLEEN